MIFLYAENPAITEKTYLIASSAKLTGTLCLIAVKNLYSSLPNSEYSANCPKALTKVYLSECSCKHVLKPRLLIFSHALLQGLISEISVSFLRIMLYKEKFTARSISAALSRFVFIAIAVFIPEGFISLTRVLSP